MSGLDRAAIIPLPTDADPASCCRPVAGVPTVVRAVRALHGCVRESRIAVVAPVTSEVMVRGALAKHGCADVVVIGAPSEGGRSGALVAGAKVLFQQANTSSILVHDVRYPLVPAAVAERLLAELQAGHRVVVPVVPVTDSVKSVDGRAVVTATVDRTVLLTAQYPRGFAASTLGELGSDDVAVALAAGLPVATVEGHPDGLRFAVPGDVTLLEAIIASRA